MILGRELHALASTGCAGRRPARHQRRRPVPSRNPAGTPPAASITLERRRCGSELHALSRRQQRRSSRSPRHTLNRHGPKHPAHVIGMESPTGTEIKLGPGERPQYHTALGLQQRLAGLALKSIGGAVITGAVILLAQTQHRPQPGQPVRGEVDIGAQIQQMNLIRIAHAPGGRNLDRHTISLRHGTILERRPGTGYAADSHRRCHRAAEVRLHCHSRWRQTYD